MPTYAEQVLRLAEDWGKPQTTTQTTTGEMTGPTQVDLGPLMMMLMMSDLFKKPGGGGGGDLQMNPAYAPGGRSLFGGAGGEGGGAGDLLKMLGLG